MPHFCPLSIIIASSFVVQPLAAQSPLVEGGVKTVYPTAFFRSLSAAIPNKWFFQFEEPGSRYLRILFDDIQDTSDKQYSVTLRDRGGALVETIQSSDFRSRGSFWTGIINSDFVQVDVISSEAPLGLQFKITHVAFQRNTGAPFSILYPDDREPIKKYRSSLPPLFSAARSVAKVSFVVEQLLKSCTGFLVGEAEFLTNAHCFTTDEICKTAIATFGYEYGENGLGNGEQFACKEVIKFDRKLDYAFLRLERNPGAKWGYLELADRFPTEGEQLFLVQHPAGEHKQVTRNDCNVSTALADGYAPGVDFGHKCDTLGGSSGSPILDMSFKVVGIHHLGWDDLDNRWKQECRAIRAEIIKKQL